MTTLLGIIGDIHQDAGQLEAAVGHLQVLGVERIICTGDVVDGYGNPDRCIDLLRAHGVEAVLGNHDRWFLTDTMRDLPDALPPGSLRRENLTFLSVLPKTRTYDTPLGPLLLCHGMADNDMGTLGPDDEGYALDSNTEVQAVLRSRYRIVVAGHTHKKMLRKIGGVIFINAGTLLRGHEPGVVVVAFEQQEVQFIDLEAPGHPVRVLQALGILGP